MSAVLKEEQDEVTFQRSQVEDEVEDQSALLPHYGCSPFMDIDVRDRTVLPPDQLVIQRCALVEFTNIPYKVVPNSDEASAPGVAVEGNRATSVGGLAGSAAYARRTKSARACAEEMIFAYQYNNPWGFQVFTSLTGRNDAFEIFRSVLPRKMTAREMYDHLISLGELTGPREQVRRQLVTACEEFIPFVEETLSASAQEIADRKAGGKGKARFDKRDEKLSLVSGDPLPDVQPKPVIQMPAQPTVDLSPIAEIFKAQAEENQRAREEDRVRMEELAAQVAALSARKGRQPRTEE